MRVFVLGGGPAGLALSHRLAENDIKFVLIERNSSLGGLAQTIDWCNHGRHDLGPHKIFTTNLALMNRVKSLLDEDDWLERDKSSSIFMKGRFLPYPPSPFSLFGVYGPLVFLRMCVDYATALVLSPFNRAEPETFDEDLKQRVGTGLYRALFEPIARKLWGDPTQLDAKLSRGRVQIPSTLEIIQLVLGIRRESTFEAQSFLYPKGGLQRLWDAILVQIDGKGLILSGTEVVEMDVEGERVSSIEVRTVATGEKVTYKIEDEDFIVSTLPIGLLSSFMPAIDERLKSEIAQTIQLNDLLLVFLKIDRQRLLSESWIFVPDPDILFHRVSEQASFDPGMTPNGSVVCCEVMNNELRHTAKLEDSMLIQGAVQGLAEMGFVDFEVQDARVIRLPKSYPVFRPGYLAALSGVLDHLDGFENFRTIGRQGAFNYIGTLDAMDIGYGCGDWLASLHREGFSPDWKLERERTKHYPVLD